MYKKESIFFLLEGSHVGNLALHLPLSKQLTIALPSKFLSRVHVNEQTDPISLPFVQFAMPKSILGSGQNATKLIYSAKNTKKAKK